MGDVARERTPKVPILKGSFCSEVRNGRGVDQMNSQQIQCLIEVGKESSFTKAANNLYLTQSTVSRYIASLERELGHILFVRTGNRKVELTKAGQSYFDLFSRFMKEYHEVTAQIDHEQMRLRLGYDISWNISPLLSEAARQYRRIDPDTKFSFECWELRALLQALNSGRLDAVLIMDNYPIWNGTLERERITTIRRGVIYSDLFLDHEATNAEDFNGCDFFIVDDRHVQQLMQDLEQDLRGYGFTPRLVEVANYGTVMACIEGGLGVALMDEWNLRPGLNFWGCGQTHTVCLAWRTGEKTPAILQLKDILIKILSKGMQV